MRKVFLDVGAHTGESARAALDPRYGFSDIYCFEPALACHSAITQLKDKRIHLMPFGLWNETATLPIFGAGGVGASLFEEKAPGSDAGSALLIQASTWFRENLRNRDTVFMKVNVEGAEVEILSDLLDAGEIAKITHAIVCFDVRMIPSRRHLEKIVRDRLDDAGVSYVVDEGDVSGVSHVAWVQNWLDIAGARETNLSTIRRLQGIVFDLRYKTIQRVDSRLHIGRRVAKLLPARTYLRILRFFGIC